MLKWTELCLTLKREWVNLSPAFWLLKPSKTLQARNHLKKLSNSTTLQIHSRFIFVYSWRTLSRLDSSQYPLIRSVLLPDLVQTWKSSKNKKFPPIDHYPSRTSPTKFSQNKIPRAKRARKRMRSLEIYLAYLALFYINSAMNRFKSSNFNNHQILVEKCSKGFQDAWNILKDVEIIQYSLIFKEYFMNDGLSYHLET